MTAKILRLHPQPTGWTVGKLRDALKGIDNDMPVVVEVFAEKQAGGDHLLGGLYAASPETRCDELEAFYISGNEDELPLVKEEDEG